MFPQPVLIIRIYQSGETVSQPTATLEATIEAPSKGVRVKHVQIVLSRISYVSYETQSILHRLVGNQTYVVRYRLPGIIS